MRSLISGSVQVANRGALAVSVLFLASCGNPVGQTPVPAAIDGSGVEDAGPDGASDADADAVDSESGGGDASTSGGGGGDAATVMDDGSPAVDAFVDVGPAPVIDAGAGSLPSEPQFPPPCATLLANKTKAGGTLADESNPDTARIQAAIDGCSAGQSVQLAVGAGGDAFLAGPLTMKTGVALWVDTNATLFASRDPRDFDVAPGTCGTFANNSSSGCKPLIAVTVAKAGIVGGGTIDGRGGEPMVGATTTWWDVAQGAKTAGMSHSCPTLIQAKGAQNFTLYKISLYNSPNAHVSLGSRGFIVWGVTVLTPSAAANSLGKALTASYARNTDGIDPNGASDGYIVYSKISDGDDQIAIKAGGGGPVANLVIAHNHFGSGHGMSIGSETNSGVSNVQVYDLSIDGTLPNNGIGGSSGIRIKSDASRGGLVTNVTYSDICVRGLPNPIYIDPHYTTATGMLIPQYTGITIRNVHSLASSIVPAVILNGYDGSHVLGVTLDNVIVEGIVPSKVTASFANATLGPGQVNFTPAGANVAVVNNVGAGSQPNPCTGKWVAF